jgi:hypothetical protein
MPLWSQSDKGLANYLTTQGYNVGNPPNDKGWCGGVSAGMVLKTYFEEITIYSTRQSTSYPSPYSASDTEYPFILKSMLTAGTNIVAGGTGNPSAGLNTLFNFCGMTFENFGTSERTPYLSATGYAHGMPLGWMAVTGAGGADPHSLAINGTEGSYYKIYDPWGAVYNATIDANAGTLTFANGTQLNEISTLNGGVANIWPIQWIKDYVSVTGAGAQYGCQ